MQRIWKVQPSSSPVINEHVATIGHDEEDSCCLAWGAQVQLLSAEENGKDAGVHGKNKNGDYFTILESPVYHDEVTGLAFSPDGMHMILAYQENGILFDVTREDGLPFHAQGLDVQYHTGA